jgi:hypothetical protein
MQQLNERRVSDENEKMVLCRLHLLFKEQEMLFMTHITLYDLVNETNLVRKTYFQFVSSIFFINSTSFGLLQVHHQEE